MKYLKRTIIFLLIVIIILTGSLVIYNKKQKNKVADYKGDITNDFIKEMGLVNNYTDYFSTKKMIDLYIEYIASSNTEAIYGILDRNDIKENGVSKEIVEISKNSKNIIIKKMYNQKNDKNEVYYIESMYKENDKEANLYLELYTDNENLTYSIKHISKEQFEERIKTNIQIEAKKIEKNDYNKLVSILPTEKEIATLYFENLIRNILEYPEYVYGMLEEEYKNKRFPTYDEFKKFIENRKDIYVLDNPTFEKQYKTHEEYMLDFVAFKPIELEGYQKRNNDGDIRYICMDNYKNYYIFYAKSPLNYTVMLDSYTIELPEFKKKYLTATKQEKIGMNIEKIVEALNARDYEYIYSKLADEFKANNFKTYEDFEKYAKKTFNIGYEVTFNEYKEASNLSTYNITLTREKSSKTITKTIVMKLEEGTDFVMSFNVQ